MNVGTCARLKRGILLLNIINFRTIHSSNVVYKSSKLVLKELDKKWITKWKETTQESSLSIQKNNALDAKPEFYCLSMFPYPSGMLHMGHLRVYTISDVISRFKKLKGFHVIHPMGWDSFGLPAENAAVERGINPAVWTNSNIKRMKEQMKLMLADFDWDREISTCSEEYYKWTQKIFILLYQHGLAYRKKAEINWDPVDMTVLANEQVDSEGRSWRSGAFVQKRQLEQWFIKITEFADDLDKDLEILDQWPDRVKSMQRNWIGKSQGADIKFPTSLKSFPYITVFTTRPDTLFSVQFLALSVDHPIVKDISATDEELKDFCHSSKNLESDTKAGFPLDMKVTIPIDVNNKMGNKYDIPVFVAPYVLSSYGHGAVMGCPGHDERDFEFWKVHNPHEKVIKTVGISNSPGANISDQDVPYTERKGFLFDSCVISGGLESLGVYNKKSIESASQQIISTLKEFELGHTNNKYRLRDWLISRQRYWGAPIPIVHCDDCGPVPVPDEHLPVRLPLMEDSCLGKGNSLEKMYSFVNVKCPSCGKDAKRETDTMDTFMDSSWYFFRYLDSKNSTDPFARDSVDKNMPVDLYIGGVEHAILHLLYSRFISKFLGSIGMWGEPEFKNEPFKKLVTQGMVHGKTYRDSENGRIVKSEDVYLDENNTLRIVSSDNIPVVSFEKMSKSKHNGADPAEFIGKYGADATRALMLFSAPISDVLNWHEEQIHGICRWLNKVYDLSDKISDHITTSGDEQNENTESFANVTIGSQFFSQIDFNKTEKELYDSVQRYVTSVTDSIEIHLSFNTIISDYMKLTNSIVSALKSGLYINHDLLIESYKNLLILMAPVTPCVSEECWEDFTKRQNITWSSIFNHSFPKPHIIETSTELYKAIINGKLVCSFTASKELSTWDCQKIKEEIFNVPEVYKEIEGRTIKKIISKPGLISVVLDCK